MSTFIRVMLMTIAIGFGLGTMAYAHTLPVNKHGVQTEKGQKKAKLGKKKTKHKKKNMAKAKKRGGKVNTNDLACFADALEHEPTQNLLGRVTAGHAILIRATQHGSICRATNAKGQFEYNTKRAPSAETMRIATAMYNDWKNGKATFEVDLQRKVWGCWYFHDKSVTPSWAVKFKRNGGFCGEYAGLFMYRDPSKPLQLAYKQ